jgi:hypothetical protein
MSDEKIDGIVSFAGGMNSAADPYTIGENQYVYSVNQVIPKSSSGIETRKGFRPIKIIFETSSFEEIWTCGNPQGCGTYKTTKGDVVLVYSVGGYIYELTGNKYIMNAVVINKDNQYDSEIKHHWISPVPNGAIINDGIEAALFTDGLDAKKLNPNKREIGPGLMGVYVQNRFWYVKPNKKEIWASTINQPMSLDEALIDNIYGVILPEDGEINAIGKQQTAGRDAIGGNLVFGTSGDIYSVDVRGPRNNWGSIGGRGTGFVDNILPRIGSIGGNSFETFGGNVFFRNATHGLVSINQSRADFQSKDSYTSHSIEASLFFDNDTKSFLSSCYTKAYRKSLYTTIAPELRDGFVYWNGLIVKTPDPYYGRQSRDNNNIDIVESIFTGLRPWNIQTSGNTDQSFFVLSYDYDCKNRLYIYDESLLNDIDNNGKSVVIESQLATRFFDFKQPLYQKINKSRIYTLDNIQKDTTVAISTRTSNYGAFENNVSLDFKLSNACDEKEALTCSKCPEVRENVSVSPDKKQAFGFQDLFVIKGWCALKKYIRVSSLKPFDLTLTRNETSARPVPEKCNEAKIFSYKISQ